MSEYAGYRLQINGEIFPNSMIAQGSYNIIPSDKRIAAEFMDALGKKHVRYYPHNGVQITFKIRKRTFKEHEDIVHFFQKDGIYDLVYWDDTNMNYQTGDFSLNAIQYQHKKTGQNSIYYEETQINFERL